MDWYFDIGRFYIKEHVYSNLAQYQNRLYCMLKFQNLYPANLRRRYPLHARVIALRIGLIVIAILATLAMLELLLSFFGVSSDYSQEDIIGLQEIDLIQDDWWFCDSLGCRVDRKALEARAAAGNFPNIHEHFHIINDQGFHDEDSFTADALPEDALKVLALGDSFTFGMNADVGNGWIDQLEDLLQEETVAAVWNTGMPGSGTEQSLRLLETYAPIMQPDIILIGFYLGNDFDDNLYPLDKWIYLNETLVKQYAVNQTGEINRLSSLDLYRKTQGQPALDASSVELIIRSTRVGSIAWQGIDTLRSRYRTPKELDILLQQRAIYRTRQHLTDIMTYTEANDIPLYVLLIPDIQHIDGRNWYKFGVVMDYSTTTQMFDDLNLKIIDMLDDITIEDYVEHQTLAHWNNDGHDKAARIVFETIQPLIDQ